MITSVEGALKVGRKVLKAGLIELGDENNVEYKGVKISREPGHEELAVNLLWFAFSDTQSPYKDYLLGIMKGKDGGIQQGLIQIRGFASERLNPFGNVFIKESATATRTSRRSKPKLYGNWSTYKLLGTDVREGNDPVPYMEAKAADILIGIVSNMANQMGII